MSAEKWREKLEAKAFAVIKSNELVYVCPVTRAHKILLEAVAEARESTLESLAVKFETQARINFERATVSRMDCRPTDAEAYTDTAHDYAAQAFVIRALKNGGKTP